MKYAKFFRPALSLVLIFALTLSLCACSRGKAFVKGYLNGSSSGALDSSFDATVQIPPAPTTAPTLQVPLTITRRPATAGVPLAEAANVRDVARIALVGANNQPVPAQFRVLARWRGAASDGNRPIKWLLVDTDAATGEYHLELGSNPAPTAKVSAGTANSGATKKEGFESSGRDFGATNQATAAGSKFSLQTGRLQLAAKGSDLLTSFVLDGTERLTQPVTITIEQPRATLLIADAAAGSAELKVADAAALAVGAKVRFEHIGELPFESPAGANRVTAREQDQMYEPNRSYRLDEGTPRQEDIFITRRDDGGWIYTRAPLRFSHPPRTRIHDLGSEEETVTIKSIRDQIVTLDRPTRLKHNTNEKMIVDAAPLTLTAVADETKLEEAGPLRTVARQDGHFQSNDRGAPAGAMLRFTLRYHVYASQPFVRAQLRIVNTGPFGFGGGRNDRPPYAQHALIKSLQVHFPFGATVGAKPQRLEARNEDGAKVATLPLGKGLEIAAPEFAENFPKALGADATGAHFEILPKGWGEMNGDYVFDGARAKTTDFYFGLETKTAVALTNSVGLIADPEYVATTQAVRPLLVEKRNWTKAFPEDRILGVAAMRMERWLAGLYANEANEGNAARPAQSVFEVRRMSREGNVEKDNGHFGWRNFGDFIWAEGYTNLHYDIHYITLREFLRTGDKRAFQLGSEMARYRADWGQHQSVDYWDGARTFNFKGYAFYEKGDHGTYKPPLPSHHWVEGLWLYWALTGDEAVHQAALDGSDVLLKHPMDNYLYGLNYNESRWVGWPAYGLMAAWRYAGNVQYFEMAKKLVYLMVQAEEQAGRKGYFIPSGSPFGRQIQPFMWSGYAQLGTIEYWRETGDKRVADFLVRIADWLIGAKGERPVLKGGRSQSDGRYEPMGTAFYWAPDKEVQDPRVTELGMMSVPVLTVAARITGRADLRDKARLLFRDVTYFRDAPDNAVLSPAELSLLNFRSPQFMGTYIKAYGHFGLFVPDYLADLMNAPKSGK
ncbi:MAG: hypothetical protein U0Y68_01715 [Blastocatellia bacterium]